MKKFDAVKERCLRVKDDICDKVRGLEYDPYALAVICAGEAIILMSTMMHVYKKGYSNGMNTYDQIINHMIQSKKES